MYDVIVVMMMDDCDSIFSKLATFRRPSVPNSRLTGHVPATTIKIVVYQLFVALTFHFSLFYAGSVCQRLYQDDYRVATNVFSSNYVV